MNIDEFEKILHKCKERDPILFTMGTPDPPANDTEIAKVERELGFSLSARFAQFLKRFGGGDFCLSVVYCVFEESQWYISSKYEETRSFIKGSFVPFSQNFCGDYYLFEVSGGVMQDAVFWWDHETSSIEKTEFGDILEFLARHAFEA